FVFAFCSCCWLFSSSDQESRHFNEAAHALRAQRIGETRFSTRALPQPRLTCIAVVLLLQLPLHLPLSLGLERGFLAPGMPSSKHRLTDGRRSTPKASAPRRQPCPPLPLPS